MKTKSIMFIAAIMIISSSVFAQGNPEKQGPRNGDGPYMNIPDLTDDQTDQIADMRTAHMKDMMPLQNEIREKEAKLHTASTGDNVDINKVNALIEEIGKIKIEAEKKRAAFRQDIRKILTDDQRVYFDMHSHNKRHKGMMHKEMNNKCRQMQN